MKFRLFGVNVEVQMLFWAIAVLFGIRILRDPTAPRGAIVAWVGVVFVSVLVHELGHALAIKRHRIEPEISLHGMGGTTSWQGGSNLSRVDHILISLAGPFAGFGLAGLVLLLVKLTPRFVAGLHPLAVFTLDCLLEVNILWGLINLLPVLPFDGGHVLENALGPRRVRATAVISGLVGVAVAAYFLSQGSPYMTMLFGFSAIQSFQRFNAEPAAAGPAPQRKAPPPVDDEIPAELAALLTTARSALAKEDLTRAISIAETVYSATPRSPRAAVLALEIIAWARLLQDDPREAAKVVESAQSLGKVDDALVGATLHATGDLVAARRVLEGAFRKGDNRKEVVGPLIQVLIQQGEIPRAAAVALDIVETLSQEDVRKMAEITLDNRAFEWAARLFEASFARAPGAEDAYAAARAHALGGQHDRAVEWLRHAVAAGFSDRARAWSDAALEALRTGPDLEAVLPRP